MSPLRRQDMTLRSARTREIRAVWDERWFGRVVSLNTIYHPEDVDGLALVDDRDEPVALATFHVEGPSAQIVTIDTILRGRGFGWRMLESLESKMHARGIGRMWAVFTNDNLRAAGMYISRGYRLVRVHLDAVEKVREHKPALPEKGYHAIPIRDLWEVEKVGLLSGIPVP